MADQADELPDFADLMRARPLAHLPQSVKQRHVERLRRLPDDVGRRTGQPRSRKILVTVAAVVALSVSVTAAALGVFSAPPTDRRIAYCYTTADLHDPTNHLDITVATPAGGSPSEHDAAAEALDICQGAWMQGRLSATDPKVLLDPKPAPWNYPIPQLVVCVLDSGEVGVFPGQAGTCGSLGLPVAKL